MNTTRKIEKIISEYIECFSINEDNIYIDFDNLGLDSMDVMGIFSDLESEYGITVSDDDFHLYNTISDIYKLFND